MITRPAIANERLTLNRAGEVVLQLKSPYHDGTTHIVMSPLEFLQRLAALVPRPRLHLIRFHGVLAPNAKLRPAIIPSAPSDANPAAPDQAESPHSSPLARMSWARLLKRVFNIDLEHCPHCGGTLTIIAAILDPTVKARPREGPVWRAEDASPKSLPISAYLSAHRPVPPRADAISSTPLNPPPTTLLPQRQTPARPALAQTAV